MPLTRAALHGGGLGARRPHRAGEEQGLSRLRAASPRQGHLPLHPRFQTRAGCPQVGRHRRLRLRPRPGEEDSLH